MSRHRFTLVPHGAFDLARSIAFLEEWPAAPQPVGQTALRFAFCAEHDWRPVGVSITTANSTLEVTTTAPVDEHLRAQVARILSVDIDATGLDALGDRDPVVAGLLRSRPGLRPVCFWSPWEAACWAVLAQRTSMRTASMIKQRIAHTHGTRIEIDGQELFAFPGPQTLLDTTGLPGVNPIKLARIHGLAAAALTGVLTADTLRAQTPEHALEMLRELPGIGPFSAGLILIRGAGAPDVFTTSEPRLLRLMREVYQLDEDTPDSGYAQVAQAWRPFRSWVAFWLRSASQHTLQTLIASTTAITASQGEPA